MTVLFPCSQVKKKSFLYLKVKFIELSFTKKCVWSIKALKKRTIIGVWSIFFHDFACIKREPGFMIADSNLIAEVIVFAEIWMKKLYLQPRCRLHSVWSVSREQSSSLAQMWSTREPPTHLGYDSSSPPNPWKRCGAQSGWSGLVWFLLCHKTSHTCRHTYIPLILKQKHTEWIAE